MRRVDSAGSGFLYGETAGWHMHVGALMVLDPADAEGFGFDAVKHLYAERLAQVPDLRARLVEVPFGLDRPVLGHDPTFDVEAHCRRVTVPAPGTERELGVVLGSIMAGKIDRRRPLWEMWWIDGLADGHVGVFVKMHHALIDGYSGMQLAALVMDLESAPAPADAAPGVTHDAAPSPLRLGAEAARTLAALPWRTVRYANQLARQTATMVRHSRRPDSPPTALSAPRTSFNVPIGARRSVAMCSLPLDDILAVKEAFGTSVNDVLLAVVGGALRTHLDERGALPGAPLIAQVPVSVHKPDDHELGTQVVNMFTTLATDVAECTERLRVVSAVTARAKQFQHDLFADRVLGIPEVVPPSVIGAVSRAFTGLGLERHIPPIYNAIVSDVRGSPVDLYVAGARVQAIHPFGPLLLGAGLNITALSHLDRLNIGILGTPESLPDPWPVAASMEAELAALLAAAADLEPAEVDLVAAEGPSDPGDGDRMSESSSV